MSLSGDGCDRIVPTTVGIIADLHDNFLNFEVFLRKAPVGILDELWIAGDVGTPETLKAICNQFKKPIRIVAGNVEKDHGAHQYQILTQLYPKLDWSATAPMTREINRYSVALFHDFKQANEYARQKYTELVVAGHTHQPDLKHYGETWLINPGALGGCLTHPTYVLANLKQFNLQLKRI